MAKNENRTRVKDNNFGKWKNTRACQICLLTPYDRNIQWYTCVSCTNQVHGYCQLLDNSIVTDEFMCRNCRHDLKEPAELIYLLNEKSDVISVSIKEKESDLKLKEATASGVAGQAKSFMGKLREGLKKTAKVWHLPNQGGGGVSKRSVEAKALNIFVLPSPF